LENVHIPYSLSSAFFLISVVPPIFSQLTDAGLAMPAEVGDIVTPFDVFVAGVCTMGICWVQPAMKIPATMQRPRMIKIPILVIMIYQKRFRDGCIKKCGLPQGFVIPEDS